MKTMYNEQLVMPTSFAIIDEEEMTYIDGGFYRCGTTYFDNVDAAYDYLSNASMTCMVFAGTIALTGAGAVAAATVGGAIGNVPGAIIGAALGLLAGSYLWGLANTFDNAAMDVKNLSRDYRVEVFAELNNTTFRLSVSSDYSTAAYWPGSVSHNGHHR